MKQSRIHYYTHRGRRAHPSSIVSRLGTHIILPFALILLACFVVTGAFFLPLSQAFHIDTLLSALGASLLRLLLAYALSLLVGIPLGLLAEKNRHVESFLLPVYDVLE